ncbi:MAG: His-Xaa-Ser system radical SAM maturase HxsB [Bacteroidota bacterium]
MNEPSLHRKTRKFSGYDAYSLERDQAYHLLPFRFHRIHNGKEVLVSEIGDFLIVPGGTAQRIITRELSKAADPVLYADLESAFFISETAVPPLIDVMATRYRTKKSFLDYFTSLHIFVISLRCEHTCHYCQVSRASQDKNAFDMSHHHIDKGIAMMMRSPSPHVTMEFQGGEALLAFDNIVYAVEKVKEESLRYNKDVTYVICTNLALLNDEIALYCKENRILLSTSLDGPAHVHNQNRHRPGNNSYELAVAGIELAREILGRDRVSALLTTTNLSLQYPRQIVDEYFARGFRSIFLRPISPYGFAARNEKKNRYLTADFLAFYKEALAHIIDYNLSGEFFREDYACIILKKMLTPFPVGYVDLQSPAGMINNVIVFNYDGSIYATDESRMLAEMKDFSFLLGSLDTHSYEEIFYGDKAMTFSECWSNESLPGCSDCAFQSYCGADPVFHHATQGDMVGHRPTSSFCQRNMGIITHLIELMDSDARIEKIFRSWISGRN